MINDLWPRLVGKNYYRLSILALLIFASYFQPLIAPTTVSPDANLIIQTFNDQYFKNLISLQAVDFQPVRDLSLAIDWFIFNKFQLNTFIWQNALIWFAICLSVFSLLRSIFPKHPTERLFFYTCLFAVYPLFTYSVSWSIARKHLLSMLFIFLATRELFQITKPSPLKINIYFLFAMLSQPIGILWPFWAMYFVFAYHRQHLKNYFSTFVGLIISFLTVASINYAYYQKSTVFSSVYQSKTADAFSLADKILAIGHYAYQMFVPYQLAFYYDLGHWSVFVGMLLIGALYLIWRSKKLPSKDLLTWSMFALFPLLVVLNTPHTKFDTYLLLPSLALLVMLIHLDKNFLSLKWLFPLLLIWTSISHIESSAWSNQEKFWQQNFERRPTCIGAIIYSKLVYRLEKYPPPTVMAFMQDNECLLNKTANEQSQFIVMQADALFYNPGIPVEKRLELLDQFSQMHWYAKLVKAGVLAQANRKPEAQETLHQLSELALHRKAGESYLPMVKRILHPMCLELQDEKCLKVTSLFIEQKPKAYW